MPLSIESRARRDWKRLSQAAFSDTEITISSPDNAEIATIKGLSTSHSMSFGTDGLATRGRNIHVSFSEEALMDENPDYPIRPNNEDDINLRGHFVEFNDSTGTLRKYKVDETWPDQTVGMVICMCEPYEEEF